MEPQDSAWKVTENLIKLNYAEVEGRGKMFMAITVSSGPQMGQTKQHDGNYSAAWG